MSNVDPSRLEKVVDELAPLFYAFMAVSLLAILVGSMWPGALLLILGAAVQVVRGGCEELAFTARRRAERLRSVSSAARGQGPRRSRRPARDRALVG
jgi:cytochrome c biogenesis protein ResB